MQWSGRAVFKIKQQQKQNNNKKEEEDKRKKKKKRKKERKKRRERKTERKIPFPLASDSHRRTDCYYQSARNNRRELAPV